VRDAGPIRGVEHVARLARVARERFLAQHRFPPLERSYRCGRVEIGGADDGDHLDSRVVEQLIDRARALEAERTRNRRSSIEAAPRDRDELDANG
jgi:hypothetical protein